MEVTAMLRKEKGFTLIELLIVVAIIGIIAAIAVPNLLAAIQRSKRSRTAADIRAIGTALGSYNVDFNQFPAATTFAEVYTILNGGKFYQGSKADGWGNTYIFKSDGKSPAQGYTIISYAKDNAQYATKSEFDSDLIYVDGGFTAPESLAGK